MSDKLAARPNANPKSPPAAEQRLGPDSRTADYAVGYGRPPVQTRFRPGASGNPKGRPKGATGLNTLVRDMMTEKMTVQTAAGVTKKIPRVEVLLRKVFELAVKGDPRAQSQLLNLYAEAVPEVPPEPLGGSSETEERVALMQKLAIKFLERGAALRMNEVDDDW